MHLSVAPCNKTPTYTSLRYLASSEHNMLFGYNNQNTCLHLAPSRSTSRVRAQEAIASPATRQHQRNTQSGTSSTNLACAVSHA